MTNIKKLVLLVAAVAVVGGAAFWLLGSGDSSTSETAQTEAAPASVGKVDLTSRTRFYNAANVESGVVGSFPANVTVNVTEAVPGWMRVTFNGLSGWIQEGDNVKPAAE